MSTAVVGSVSSSARSRRLDEDFYIAPFINEVRTRMFNNLLVFVAIHLVSTETCFQFSNFDAIVTFIELLNINPRYPENSRRERDLAVFGEYGDKLFYYDGDGNFLGSQGITITVNNTGDKADDIRTLDVTSKAYIPTIGGIVCLKGTDPNSNPYFRTIAYGTTTVTEIPQGSLCEGQTIDENISDFTTETPGPTESYQRVGFGLEPEDFSWSVQEATKRDVNTGQSFPECTDLCSTSGGFLSRNKDKFTIHKTGLFGRCRTRCVTNFWARCLLRGGFFGKWTCGPC